MKRACSLLLFLLSDQPSPGVSKVETNILEPLKEYGHIDSYENMGDDPKSPKYRIKRSGHGIIGNTRDEAGSVKDEAGSVKDEAGSVKRNRY